MMKVTLGQIGSRRFCGVSIFSLRSRRQHKARGEARSAQPQESGNGKHQAHAVGDSARSIARFTGLYTCSTRLPRVPLALHPGLYAATRFAGWGKAIPKRLIASCTFLCTIAFFSGCSGIQSALDPAGPQAQRISHLWWLFFWVCSLVFVLVMGALVYAVRRGRGREAADGASETERRSARVVAGAVAVTIIILFVFLIADFSTGRALSSLQSTDAVNIKVTGHQWWWDFEYVESVPSQHVRTSNELHLPTGRPVKFEMTSQDVIHSFWVPNLHGKTDLLTGYQTVTWLQADRPGKYRGQCAEYCGHQHAHMAFLVIAEPPDQFNAWLNNQRRPAPQPATAEQQAGEQIFLTRACVMCHQIRGTDAGAVVAPDLTHLATRQSIAAGTLPNQRDNLRSWITNPQHIKPGNRMPSNTLSDEELNALLSYLQSLK